MEARIVKLRVSKCIGPVYGELGWFEGEDYKLLNVTLVDHLTLFQIHILKFIMGVAIIQ